MNVQHLQWWSNLRHGGMLLDVQRLSSLVPSLPEPLAEWQQDRLRREVIAFQDDPSEQRGQFVAYVLQKVCDFALPHGNWYRAGNVAAKWSRRALTGEAIRPSHLYIGEPGGVLPVFIDDQKRLGIGRGKRIVSQVLQWLRQGDEQLAILTNGQQWRIIFAGLDYEAFCEWDIDQWFAEGQTSEEFGGFRALVAPATWNEPEEGKVAPLLAAVNESRKGQADLSQVLGERVRQAAELLIQAHTPALKDHIDGLDSQDIYRAAVRMIMRLVVALFAESREGLLPRDNPVYHSAYSLQGLRELLERISPHKLVASYGAYPRILALLRLIHQGSSHEGLPVPSYGGELFAPGNSDDGDGMKRALHLFETACFGADVMTDYEVRQILDLLTRTKVKIRQGRSATWMPAPVDFSSLDSEYIGILYEGLLDFELRCAVEDEPIVFLAVGNQPALPLSTLEQMDDRAIKNLLEKLKDTSSSADDEEGSGEDAEETEDLDEADEDADSDEEGEEEIEEEDATATEEAAADDPRYTLQARAEQWARKACEVGNLVNRPRGRMTPERQMQYDRALNSKARQLVVKVVLPGEWYLVRWGGTRKGSGTFYTRPQLAIPTAHRTLRPLAYDPPTGEDGQPDTDALAEKWTPKKPEDILDLKVCDPACGSGSFCLAALRFLTTALFESLVVHDRIRDHAGRAVLDLIHGDDSKQALASEALPCRPEDDEFELRTKAILRRYIVERCIYGVDLDPLAVELCRLSLWIETLDRSLPLTFLNHKVKCGNSLVGAWFDQFLHYPAMAWDREGGDKNHTNGVHYEKEAWTKAIKEFKNQVKEDLKGFIDGGRFEAMFPVDLTTVSTGHDAAEAALKEIHALGITDVDERARKYDALRASEDFRKLKDAFDLWCALWFWPADQLDAAPLPTPFASGEISEAGLDTARQVADQQRFFHWELEFPDVFNASSTGFDAILGNPPWETLQPNSKEFFSAFDPLYRSYGKQEALRKQKEYFQGNEAVERQWLLYTADYKAIGEWVKYAGFAFGDRVTENSQGKESHDLNLGDRGRSSFTTSQRRHDRWKAKRDETNGYADPDHSFRYQGAGKAYTYKMFLEQSHSLLRVSGRMGMIQPSAFYTDKESVELRKLLQSQCSWEWLFSYENKHHIFDIANWFKFCILVVQRGGTTDSIKTSFMRHRLADWEHAENFVVGYHREQVLEFSPNSLAILEIDSERDLELLTKMYLHSVLLGDESESGWSVRYSQGDFNMTSDSKLFSRRLKKQEEGFTKDEYGRWGNGEETLLPLLQGTVIWERDSNYQSYVSGTGLGAVWERVEDRREFSSPQFLMEIEDAFPKTQRYPFCKGALRNLTRATAERTIVSSVVPNHPCGNSIGIFDISPFSVARLVQCSTGLSSLACDWIARQKVAGSNINKHILEELSIPLLDGPPLNAVGTYGSSLMLPGTWMAPAWLGLARQLPGLTNVPWLRLWAVTPHERRRLCVVLDAIYSALYGLSLEDYQYILRECDYPAEQVSNRQFASRLDNRGFWRVDKGMPPEHRHTVLAMVAFHDLQEKIDAAGGDVAAGIEAFCNQNDGEGWMLPETLRLADYGLGHDDRAKEHQPVRECFGPRFYDWQLAQSPEESWRECHLHARNLLGPEGYDRLIAEIEGRLEEEELPVAQTSKKATPPKGMLFDTAHAPLFRSEDED